MSVEDQGLRIDELLAESDWMRRIARGLLRDPHLAEDLAQEAMLAALRQPPQGGIHPRAWLRGVLRNLAASWTRGDAHRRQREARVEAPAHSGPAELLEELELQRLLAGALIQLGEPYRQTVYLRYFRGLSSAEIARRTGAPEGTVRWRLKRGLDTLRAQLDEEQPGGRAAWLAILTPLAELPLSNSSSLALAAGALGRRLAMFGLWGLVALLGLMIGLTLRGESSEPAPRYALAPSVGTPADAGGPAGEAAARTATTARDVPLAVTSSVETAQRVLLSARILDPDGRALPGAELALAGGPAAQSGLDGRCTLELQAPQLADAPLVELVASADRHAPRTFAARWRGEAHWLLGDIVLEPAGRVFGRALQPDGTPAAQAEILVEDLPVRPGTGALRPIKEWSYLGSMLPEEAVRARADASGRFELAIPATRYVHLWARAPGFFAACSEPIGASSSERTRCEDLVLIAPEPAELIEGRVVDPEGAPVAGAILRAWRATRPELYLGGDETAYHAVADELGRFALPVNPNPALELTARDPQGRWRATAPVRVRAGERELRLVLMPPAQVELHVTDADGRALAPIEFELEDAASGRVLSTHEGALAFELPARAFSCRVRSPGFLTQQLGPLEPETIESPLQVSLRAAPRWRGRVQTAHGPLSGARVELLRACPEGEWRIFPELVRDREPLATQLEAGGPPWSGESDERGEFEFYIEQPGRHVLRATSPDGQIATSAPFEASDPLEQLVLRFQEPGTLVGQVVVDAGAEPGGTLVAVSDGLGQLLVQRADASGAFRFDALEPGPWMVRALAHDLDESARPLEILRTRERRAHTAARFDVVVAAETTAHFELDLHSRAGFVLEGELLLDGVSPGPWRAQLVASAGSAPALPVERPAATSERVELDPRGRFRIEVETGGEYELRVWTPDGNPPRMTLIDAVQLARGASHWNLELETGILALLPGRARERAGIEHGYVWRGPGALRCEVLFRPLDIAAGHRQRLPAGPGVVLRRDGAGRELKLRELELEAGATVEFTLD